jgi:GST-like protein
MIDLYTWTTPNAQKVSIMLEEVGVAYDVRLVDIDEGEQRSAAYLAVNPNGKVPAIVDHDAKDGALTLSESNAILVYLAEKTGGLLAPAGHERAATLQWLMFQTSSIGPTFHDAYYFMALAKDRLPPAIDYFMTETTRVLTLLDTHLATHDFLAGRYSIADIATYPWIHAAIAGNFPGMDTLKSLQRWHTTISDRPAVGRGMAVPQIER